jgi:hypothetical protein
MGRIEEGGSAGNAGDGRRRHCCCAWPRWEEGDGANVRALSVSGWKREEEEGKGSWAARWLAGPEAGMGRGGLGWVCSLFFSFSFFPFLFQIFFKPISNPF